MTEAVKEAVEKAEEALDGLDGLLEPEMELAKKHGLIESEEKKDEEKKDEHEESTGDETKEDSDKEKEQKEEKKEDVLEDKKKKEEITHSSDLDTKFEEMDQNTQKEHEELTAFSPDQKSFYWKWKNDKRKRQEAVAEKEVLTIKVKEMEKRLDALATKPNDIDKILADEETRAKAKEPVTKEEYEADQKERDAKSEYHKQTILRLSQHEADARTKYSDFQEKLEVAKQVFKAKPMYYHLYVQHVQDHRTNAAEYAYEIGQLYSRQQGKDEQPVKTIEDGKPKKQTSASLPSAPSGRKKSDSYEDMEMADAVKLSPTEWMKLPRNVRQRFLNM